MRNFIGKAARYIAKMNGYTKDEEEQVEYALRIFVFEILKIAGTIIVYGLLGFTLQAGLILLEMCILKPFIGGYHEDNQIKCYLFTVIIVGFIIYLSCTVNINFISKAILDTIVLFGVYHQAPVINPNMILTKENLLNRNRVISISLTIVYTTLNLALYRFGWLSNLILWTMVVQALLMFNKKTAGRRD